MSQSTNNNELAHHHVPCDRLLQKAYSSSMAVENVLTECHAFTNSYVKNSHQAWKILWPLGKNAKREQSMSSYLDRTSLVNIGDIIWYSPPSSRFVFLLLCLPVSISLFSLFSFSSTLLVFSFSSLVLSRQRNHRKSFYCQGKYFAK